MSDSSVDRMNDAIEADGWQRDNFRRNPVALFSPRPDVPIGPWSEVTVKGNRLVGRLALMDPVSDRLREIHAAVKGGVLRAVSVGFHANKTEPRADGGTHFLETELVECSLVSVPANPNALATAKALGISREGIGLIFGGIAGSDQMTSPPGNGGIATIKPTIPKANPMQVSERIANGQTDLANLREELQTVDTEDVGRLADVTGRIEDLQGKLDAWRRAERALAQESETVTRPGRQLVPMPTAPASVPNLSLPPRSWAMPKKKDPEPGYLFLRHLVAKAVAHQEHKSPEQALAERYGHYGDFDVTREIHNWYTRAAVTAANTTTTGWAAELAQIMYGDFLASLMPNGIYTGLAPRGFRLTLGRNASASIPTRSATPTVAGSFLAEGAPIPVRRATFVPITIGLKKLGVISTFTRELYTHSTPNIEALLTDAMRDDTQVSVDTILVSAGAVGVGPAGLRNGVSGLTPTAGGGFTALIADLKALTGALAAVNGLRNPVWIMHDQQVNSIGLTQNAGGNFPFRDEIGQGTLLGYPLIKSTTQTLGQVILVAAEEFVSVTGDEPDFSVSDQATLHMEDTTPLQIGTVGAPPTVAAPAQSMFQTDSIALRMILPMNWMMRRAGMVSWVAAVTW
jgi:HK97 family phage prohead protease